MKTENQKKSNWVAWTLIAIFLTSALVMVNDNWARKIVLKTLGADPDPRWALYAVTAFILAALVWMWGLFLTNKSKIKKGIRGGSSMVIATILSWSLMMLPSLSVIGAVEAIPSAALAQQATQVTSAVDITDSVVFTAAEKQAMTEAALLHYKLTGEKTYSTTAVVKACTVQIVATLVILAGGAYIIWKVYKVCQNIKKNKKKQVDDDEEPVPSTNHSRFSYTGAEVYSTLIVLEDSLPTIQDAEDCNCGPVFCFSWETPIAGLPIVKASRSTNTIDYTEYLVRRGLPTNDVLGIYQTVNGQPVASMSQMTISSNTMTITLTGKTNVTTLLQCSTNLVDWRTILAISSPAGVTNSASAGIVPTGSPGEFWRVVPQ